MKVTPNGSRLEVVIERNFNLSAIRELEEHLSEDIDELVINLKYSFFLDSEAVIFMHRWLEKGKKLRLLNPPEIFYEILDVLDLTTSWKLDQIIDQPKEG
jgi:anti-anti-sigma regulatory factor